MAKRVPVWFPNEKKPSLPLPPRLHPRHVRVVRALHHRESEPASPRRLVRRGEDAEPPRGQRRAEVLRVPRRREGESRAPGHLDAVATPVVDPVLADRGVRREVQRLAERAKSDADDQAPGGDGFEGKEGAVLR